MTMTAHAEERVSRLLEAGVPPTEAAALLAQAEAIAARYPRQSVAILLRALDQFHGEPWVGSNGDEAWAIARQGEVKTVMLRRSTQPKRAQAFSVDKVVLV